MTGRLPPWVIDLVMAIQQHEDEHAKDDLCLDRMLALVPADVRNEAEAVHAYATTVAP